ncbi:MAG: hypothetical protein CVU62_08140 [Deltaproteobacteria bacterium HGW-Deltaproteobacteria-2]|jgi:hypothetical protein|nr:MAG: hypothetical protein CVU62_08140 [Deltaproteobacteria bacterium HGW-Deltaproteobacteria-2]
MSSLIFYTDKSQIMVATDTLATSPDGEPFMFTTKAFFVPHLRLIIAGTGVAGFLGKWFIKINDRMIVRGIDHLNYHTPSNLSLIWQEHKEEFSIPDTVTSTIYHLGFSEETKEVHVYAYRSTNDFESETLSSLALIVKPECNIPKPYELPKDFKTMMNDQRRSQSLKPKEERIYIGGEIQVHHLTTDSYVAHILEKFDDFDENENAIYENFKNNNSFRADSVPIDKKA